MYKHDDRADVVFATIGICRLNKLATRHLRVGCLIQDAFDLWVAHHFPQTVTTG